MFIANINTTKKKDSSGKISQIYYVDGHQRLNGEVRTIAMLQITWVLSDRDCRLESILWFSL